MLASLNTSDENFENETALSDWEDTIPPKPIEGTLLHYLLNSLEHISASHHRIFTMEYPTPKSGACSSDDSPLNSSRPKQRLHLSS